MKKIARLFTAALTALIPATAFASHVSPADLGKYVDRGDEFCFQDVWGAMVNERCPGTHRLVVPVHTYWAGTQRAEVNVKVQDSSQPVCCQLITACQGQPCDIGPQVCTSNLGGTQTLSVSAWFADKNPGWVLCSVPQGAQVNHVWFSGS